MGKPEVTYEIMHIADNMYGGIYKMESATGDKIKFFPCEEDDCFGITVETKGGEGVSLFIDKITFLDWFHANKWPSQESPT